MPYKEKPIEKLFYPIGEVAQMFEVNASLIRFWENEFSILKPKKNKKGNRLFTQQDVKNIKLIYQLLKEEGYTIAGAKKVLKEGKIITQKAVSTTNTNKGSELKFISKELKKVKQALLDLKQKL